MLRRALLLMAVTAALAARAQSWQEVYDDVMTFDDTEESGELLQDSYELLEQLAAQPLDLNHTSRDELEQLPFLSAQQVMDIEEYLYRYGPMRSLGELRMIRSLDRQQLALLPYFVFVTGEADRRQPIRPPLDSLLRRGKSTLSATIRIPTYERVGDKNGYLGYAYRHSLRYEWKSGDYLRLGLVGAQDAGEPFFANDNRWGYDAYSYYAQLRKMGRIENLVAGKYKFSAGLGLIMGQSFQLGKLATLQNQGRQVNTIRPHSSRSESDYMQGTAASVRLWRPVLLSAFVSYRPIDATLTNTDEAQTLITSGYHRTPTEMAKKGNTHMTSTGAHLDYRQGALRLGASAIATWLDRELQPQRQTLYRRHYAHGRHFLNLSTDYAYTHHIFAINGETAIDADGHVATLNTLSLRPSARLTTTIIQRFYSYRYTTLHGHAFGEGTGVQNESGIYVGATWNPLPHLRLQGYADYAYFPWARYQVSQTSHAWDFLIQGTYELGRWTLLLRHRSHLRQKDNEAKTDLVANDDHRQRIALGYQDRLWTLKTQLDLARTSYIEKSQGWMVSQQASLHLGGLLIGTMAALFNTDSYDSRIYLYEQQVQHEFYFPTYYGEGLRLSLQIRTDIGKSLRLAAKAGYTNYFDRSTIGSGLQLIPKSHQTDIDLQLSWKF